ncbi:hypothetical protein K470DRAFT_237292 [Piedraia hortae CBS 480.64]|uniref:Autophagy-related protein 17 n=1 Tax=Piedraia hortae CBS 480.64 TaxID=1314780 RepID=A0A6A7BS02_9PEZI|nr:hypothetical protein K470DRAFT_237292 [Piedraia hortae CBS 480.64]
MDESSESSVGSPTYLKEVPTLERLILHFIAAKRSLSCISQVQRAGELVNKSSCLVEEIAILKARNSFARKCIDKQLSVLDAISDGIEQSGEATKGEFNATVKSLDESHRKLERALNRLKETIVDSSLQEKDASSKTLFDFIDEQGHEAVVGSLHGSVDDFSKAYETWQKEVKRFESDIAHVRDVIFLENRPIYDDPRNLGELYSSMEAHAVDMASLLQSLTTHYDLCVTALKHTEGGGEAAKQAAAKLDSNAVEESLYGKTVPEPIDHDEKMDMLRVLEEDAEQVNDVVEEIKDHLSDLESQFTLLSSQSSETKRINQSLHSALEQFRQIKDKLPFYLKASTTFSESWSRIHGDIQQQREELAELTDVYAKFSESYAHALAEAGRRKRAEANMRRYVSKVQKELDLLYREDAAAREEFMAQVKDTLPRDIWPGAGEESVQWEVRPR